MVIGARLKAENQLYLSAFLDLYLRLKGESGVFLSHKSCRHLLSLPSAVILEHCVQSQIIRWDQGGGQEIRTVGLPSIFGR